MRILLLINFYLIHGSGGEDLSCQQVIAGLKQRGHTTLVLTSMHGTNNLPVEEDGISRSLYLEMDLVPFRHSLNFFTQRKSREKHNLQCLERVVEQFQPDIIFIWGMWNLPRSLAAFAETRYPDKVVYRFATYWPTLPSQHDFYWRTHGRKWYSQLPKHVLSHIALGMLAKEAHRPPLTYKNSMCVSAATRNILVEAGIPVSNARIIHTGLDVALYLNSKQKQSGHDNQSLRLLYAGRLASDKDIETAIRAVAKLVAGQGLRGISLSLAGSGAVEYENQLRNIVKQEGLTDYVSFLGWVPPEEMPGLLNKFDMLLVTSTWAEPFARVVLEGMISGLVVVATPTGGTPEIISDGENGLLFTPGDPDDLAQKIMRLVADPELRKKLALAGQQTIKEKFTMTKMMDEIEGYLQEVAQGTTQKQGNLSERSEEATFQQNLPMVSVVIPTYNRKDSLLRALESLKQQTLPVNRFEVTVVDDGSIDETQIVASQQFPFTSRYVYQKQQGATAARNYGATISMGEILVFIDDDVTISPTTLEALAEVCCQNEKVIVMGTLRMRSSVIGSVYTAILLASPDHYPIAHENLDLHFADCNTQLLACRRSDFLYLGMLQDPTGGLGWPNWDDVDFGYRAYLNGFRLLKSSKATGYHWDYSVADWTVACQRWYRASKSAVLLFKKHRELQKFIPMLRDKTPPVWGKDSLMLVVRKLTRSIGSSGPVIWFMVRLVSILEQHFPSPMMLRHLYFWLQGASMFHGYREGLRELELAGARD